MKLVQPIRQYIVPLSLAAGAVAGAATVAGFGGDTFWLLDFAAHFRPQYLLVLCGAGLVMLLHRRYRWAAVFAAYALLNAACLLPLCLGPSVHPPVFADFRLVQMNVLATNASYDKVVAFLRETNADVVVLQEVTPAWMTALDPLKDLYPYRVAEAKPGTFGIALLSRHPFRDSGIAYLGQDVVPSAVARLDLKGRDVTVVGVHPPSPIRADWRPVRDAVFRGIAARLAEVPGETVLAGDLNATPWSSPFRALVRAAGLRDTTAGFGFQPTWPALVPLLGIPIDHCLVSPGLHAVHRRVAGFTGSDHYPLVVDLAFRRTP